MKKQFFTGVALVALAIPGSAMFAAPAFAQSTGSVDFDQDAIVVTASAVNKGVAGVQIPDTSKAKGVLTQEFIARQTPGNSILDTINQLPGVSFQNNDPFGSAGGTLTIRGFDSTRISLTFDGIPLNDSGNYAVFSNQQLDPELIEQVNVNYGSTDVDSPSAAASGSTVNYRTLVPTEDFGVRVAGSAGDYQFFRIFGVVNTGVFTPFGTKAWFAASHAENDVVFNDFGKIDKQQYNGRIYQPIGSNGDFISIAGNYNQNRNNFFGSAPLRADPVVYSQITAPNAANPNTPTNIITPSNPLLIAGAVRTAGTGSTNRFPFDRSELPYSVARCTIDVPQAGVADAPNVCGTTFDERYNPSNTGNIRINSKFTLAQGLVLTVDPSFQYVKANGGGTVTAREGCGNLGSTTNFACTATSVLGVINTTGNPGNAAPGGFNYYTGIDLNGDGDKLDTVTLLAPSQTQTRRYGVIASLRYDVNENNTVRVGFTYDRARHRQTGEVGYVQANGFPFDVFPVNNPIRDANGNALQKRDRLSYATLTQISGEYRGSFFDKSLVVTIGIRAPWFQRDLNQNCFTVASNGNVACTTQVAQYATANPYSYTAASGTTPALVVGFAPPQSRTYKYNRVLPNLGLVYKFAGKFSAYFNYSKGIQVPGTDNLYQAFYFPVGSPQASPTPETTDNFDAGLRYQSSVIQASISPWYTRFTNRLASAFDPDTQSTFYRNLGRVDKYGVDVDVAVKPYSWLTVRAFGSYLKSEIKTNVVLGNCPATIIATNTTLNCTVPNAPILALTAGKRESGSPVYTFGGRISGSFGPLDLAIQAKNTGPRYLNDQNLPNLQCTSALVNQICPTAAATTAGYTGTRGFQYTVFPAKTANYTQVDIDARLSMAWAGLNDKTYLQLNVQNLFNKYYVGGFSGGSTIVYNVPFVQIGSPRAIIGTLNVAF